MRMLLLLSLISCTKHVNKTVQNPFDNSANDARLSNLEHRTSQLEQQRLDTIAEINDLQARLDANDNVQASEIAALQAQANTMSTQIASLQQNVGIVAIVDPCGDGPGFDEVLLKTNDNKYIASFSDNINGYNTRFSVLRPGSFVTTDGTNCRFSLDNAGVLHW